MWEKEAERAFTHEVRWSSWSGCDASLSGCSAPWNKTRWFTNLMLKHFYKTNGGWTSYKWMVYSCNPNYLEIIISCRISPNVFWSSPFTFSLPSSGMTWKKKKRWFMHYFQYQFQTLFPKSFRAFWMTRNPLFTHKSDVDRKLGIMSLWVEFHFIWPWLNLTMRGRCSVLQYFFAQLAVFQQGAEWQNSQ